MRVVVLIPARFGSTRLPGKPLADLAGRPVIQHVWERARQAPGVEAVAVATDDPRIAEVVTGFGGEVVLTSPTCASGTDRVAEAARHLEASGRRFDAVVNVQGDEPFLDPAAVGELVRLLREGGAGEDAPLVTLARPLAPEEADDPAVVKVVLDLRDRALYFSRAPIGRDRDDPGVHRALAHVGLYGYTAARLQAFARLSPTPLEGAERLEQLRALEHGWPILVGRTTWRGRGIDTPADLTRARQDADAEG